MTNPLSDQRLLAGPSTTSGPEGIDAHVARLGAVPRGFRDGELIAALEASGVLGRGGAGFPVGRKWRRIAERPGGRAVVVANGAEGEPGSAKDRVLMAYRPHLVLDGALLAAEAIDADEIVLYVGREHETALASMRRAVADRRGETRRSIKVVEAPIGYVAGEASAAVHYLNNRDARPTTTPPRVSERGVKGRPTLVQNVESLAYAALIARFGPEWYRAMGRSATRGTALITITGAARDEGVREIEIGTTVGEVAAAAGTNRADVRATLLGGYFGTWASGTDAWDLPSIRPGWTRRDLPSAAGSSGSSPSIAAACRRRQRSWATWPARAPDSADRVSSGSRRSRRGSSGSPAASPGQGTWPTSNAGRASCRGAERAITRTGRSSSSSVR